MKILKVLFWVALIAILFFLLLGVLGFSLAKYQEFKREKTPRIPEGVYIDTENKRLIEIIGRKFIISPAADMGWSEISRTFDYELGKDREIWIGVMTSVEAGTAYYARANFRLEDNQIRMTKEDALDGKANKNEAIFVRINNSQFLKSERYVAENADQIEIIDDGEIAFTFASNNKPWWSKGQRYKTLFFMDQDKIIPSLSLKWKKIIKRLDFSNDKQTIFYEDIFGRKNIFKKFPQIE